MAQSAASKNRAYRTAVNHGMRPVDLAITRKPVQQCEMDQIPNSVLLPVSQPSPAGHAGAAAQCAFGSIRQGIPLRSAKMMPARRARSVRRGRPPCGLVTTELAEEVRSTSTTHQERARQPCEGPPTAIECRTCCRSTWGVLLQALNTVAAATTEVLQVPAILTGQFRTWNETRS